MSLARGFLSGLHVLATGPECIIRRNRLGRMKKLWPFSNWLGDVINAQGCGVRSPRGRRSIPNWAKSTFKLVSEWKEYD